MAGPRLVEFPIAAPLTDIPGRLRALAEEIEAGRLPVETLVVVTYDGSGRDGLGVRAVGHVPTLPVVVGLLELAKSDLCAPIDLGGGR